MLQANKSKSISCGTQSTMNADLLYAFPGMQSHVDQLRNAVNDELGFTLCFVGMHRENASHSVARQQNSAVMKE